MIIPILSMGKLRHGEAQGHRAGQRQKQTFVSGSQAPGSVLSPFLTLLRTSLPFERWLLAPQAVHAGAPAAPGP